MNEALRRNPSAVTYAIQTNESANASTAPIHHHIHVTFFFRARRWARRASS